MGLDVELCVFVEVVRVVGVVGGVGVVDGKTVVVTVSVMRTVMIEMAFGSEGTSPHCPKPIWHPSPQ